MISSEATVMLRRPIDEVFAYVTDPSNEAEWHTDVIEARISPEGPPAAGKTLEAAFKFMGRHDAEADIELFEPPRRARYRFHSAPMGMIPTLTYEFEQAGAGTRFTRRVDIRPTGFARFVGPLFSPMVAKSNRDALRNLKRRLG